jgi:hypothetical protein
VTVRAYLPTTLRLLREARERGRFGPAPLAGHAVTPALAALGDEAGEGAGAEELEWAASVAASLDSLRLLAHDSVGDQAGVCRVVAAVDVPAVEPRAGDEPSGVVLQEVPLRRLAALLVDAPGAAPLVRSARDALAAGAEADDPAVERCLDEDLGWWAASELDVLLG